MKIYSLCQYFSANFQKMLSQLRSCNFFEFLAFFLPALVFSYLQIQQTKNTFIYKSFTKPYFCSAQSLKQMYLWSRPRQDLKETETRKLGSLETKTKHRDHHCLTCSGETNILYSKCNAHLCLNQRWSLDTHFCKAWSRRFQVSKLWILQRNRLEKFLKFNAFLFVVFSGKKQPKHVGKCQKLKKFNSEVMATFKSKFWQNAQILMSQVLVSNFKSRVSEFSMKSWSRSLNQVSASKVTR